MILWVFLLASVAIEFVLFKMFIQVKVDMLMVAILLFKSRLFLNSQACLLLYKRKFHDDFASSKQWSKI